MKFQGMFQINNSKTKQDISNNLVPVYQLLKPYAIDTKTGEFLNKSSEPILKKVCDKDIDEEIQSYKDSVDIYKLIERAVLSGDQNMLNQRVGTFADIFGIPDNINDFYAKFDSNLSKAAQELEQLKHATTIENASSGLSEEQVKELVAKMLKEQSVTSSEDIGGND